jgi:hypothetical protein
VRHHRLLHEKIKDKPKRAVGGTKKKSASRDSAREFSKASSSFRQDRGQRRQSVGQMTINSTCSSFDEEDEDMMSISEEASTFSPLSSFSSHHGPRRATVSNMENLSYQSEFQCSFPRVYDDSSFNPATSQWASQLHQPHPFDIPNLDTMNFVDVKSLHPHQLHQHMASAPGQMLYEAATPAASEHDVPLLSLYQQSSSPEQSSMASTSSYDWSSMIHGSMTAGEHIMASDGQTPALPFSKSASDKSLNFTLSRSPEGQDNSCLPSPAILTPFPTVEQQQQYQQHQQNQAATTINSTPGTVNLASLGLPVPPNLNISLPADLQMSAENWDNLMRCLTLMANRPGVASSAAATATLMASTVSSAGEQSG